MDKFTSIIGKKLVIRADASSSIGTGHIMRCLSIGQSWYDLGGEVYFIVREIPTMLQNRLSMENFKVIFLPDVELGKEEDAKETFKVFKEINGDCIMMDGYQFLGMYQEFLMNKKIKTIVIDDHHYSDYYYTNLLVNKGLNAKEIKYNIKNTKTKLLLGPSYTTLRREFLELKRDREYPSIAQQILITFGGSDPKNVTTRIVKSLIEISENLNLKIVVGSAFKFKEELQSCTEKLKGNYEILFNVNDMGSLMENSDLAITAGGTTLYELAYMGLPSLTLKTVENQKSAKYFDEKYNATVYLGDVEEITDENIFSSFKIISDKALRKNIGENCMRLVDGKGNERVIDQIINLVSK